MPKLVCDYEQVKSIGSNLSKTAGEISSSVKEYVTNIDNDLSEWNSPAKSSFSAVNQTQVTTTQADVEYANKLGEYIQKAAEAIQSLDEEMAGSIKI